MIRKPLRCEKVPAFVIIEITAMHDPNLYAKYQDTVAPNLDARGGSYLVRGGLIEVLEGVWHPNRIVVVRFDTAEVARVWWIRSGYAELKAMRQRSTTTNMILVEGVPNG